MTQAQDRRETLARVAAMLARRSSDRSVTQDAISLCVLSRSLSRIAERGCNEDRACPKCDGSGEVVIPDGWASCLSCAGTGSMDGKRERRLEDKARTIAALYGLRCYFQGDPRGAALYLIPQDAPNPERDASLYSSIGTAAY